MRILHVITGLSTGGAEMSLLKLLSHGSNEFESAVLSVGTQGAVGDQISALGVPVHYLGWRPPMINPFRVLSISALAHRFRPHLIQGWMPHGNLVALLAARATREHAPVLWNVRMSLQDLGNERWLTAGLIRLGAVLSRRPAAIIYNSHAGARQHEALGYDPTKSIVIPNGFDCQKFRPDPEARSQVRAELRLGENDPVIGLIARFHPMKDHAGFFEAARQVVRAHPQTRLLLAGSGVSPENLAIWRMLRENNLTDHTILLGERADVARLQAALDIACSASARAEGFSNAIGEAMACGVPCVVTDIGDSAFIVGDAGIAVPSRDPNALAQALMQLLEAGPSTRRRLGEAARQRIQQEFSLPSILRRYHDLYREQIGSGVVASEVY